MSPHGRVAAAGALAAGPALLVLLLQRIPTGPPGFLEAVADGVIRAIPPWLFDWGVSTLGPSAKGLLFALVSLGLPLMGGLLAYVLTVFGLVQGRRFWPDAGITGLVAFGLGEFVVLPILGAGLGGSGRADATPVHLPFAFACLAYGLTFAALVGGGPRTHPSAPPIADSRPVERRRFLATTAGLVGAGAWAASLATIAARATPLPRAALPGEAGAPGAEGFGFQRAVQPLGEFYTVSKDWVALQVEGAGWRLHVTGMVEWPHDWTLDELRSLPRREAYRTLQCISAESITRTALIGNQRWAGVRVRDVLAAARPSPDARFIVWRCADGYHESLDLATALRDDTWLVDEMGPPGTPLPAAHGFPLRLLVAGRYGMAQPKYLTDMIVVADDEPGWWVKAGWDTRAPIRTYCRIDLPAADGVSDAVIAGTTFTAYGVASSGDRGISAVQVSSDGGATWVDAELEPVGGPIGRLTWVRWRAPVTLATPGPALFVARAADGTGTWQDDTVETPFPRGASGYPRVPMRVYRSLHDPG